MARYHAPIGPPVTLRTAMDWFWLGCHRCSHRVAARSAIFMNELGPDYPLEGIRRRGWCTMCGKFGAYTHAPSYINTTVGDQPFDEEQSNHHHQRKLDETGQRSFLVYDAQTRLIRRDGLTIAQALQWTARANGLYIGTRGRFHDHEVVLTREGEIIWSHSAPMGGQEGYNCWPKVFALLLRENPIHGRYRAASFEHYRLAVGGIR